MTTTNTGTTMIQTRNGRTLTLDGDRYVMAGPTGTHSIAATETCLERLAAHWSGFCDKAITVEALTATVVKALMVRTGFQVSDNDWTGKVEQESTHFQMGGENHEGDRMADEGYRDALAYPSMHRNLDREGDCTGYEWTIQWEATSTHSGGIGCGNVDIESAGYEATTCRAMATKALVEHMLTVISTESIPLAQIVGAKA